MKHTTICLDLKLKINPKLYLVTIIQEVKLEDQHKIISTIGVSVPFENLIGSGGISKLV
jgi:hypothetical protein